jgi:uncharacterized protein with HEPN domain
MLDYSQKAVQFTKGQKRADLDNEMLAMAVIHMVEIIGEAASNISASLSQQHPEVPWNQITSTRNRLAHGYVDIDLDVIWSIVTNDLPPLIIKLQLILQEEGELLE